MHSSCPNHILLPLINPSLMAAMCLCCSCGTCAQMHCCSTMAAAQPALPALHGTPVATSCSPAAWTPHSRHVCVCGGGGAGHICTLPCKGHTFAWNELHEGMFSSSSIIDISLVKCLRTLLPGLENREFILHTWRRRCTPHHAS